MEVGTKKTRKPRVKRQYTPEQKARRKQIFKNVPTTIFKYDPNKRTPKDLSELLKPLWQQYLKSPFISKYKLDQSRRSLEQLVIRLDLGDRTNRGVVFPKNNNKVKNRTYIFNAKNFLKSLNAFEEIDSEPAPPNIKLEATRLLPNGDFFKLLFDRSTPAIHTSLVSRPSVRQPWVKIVEKKDVEKVLKDGSIKVVEQKRELPVDQTDPLVIYSKNVLTFVDYLYRQYNLWVYPDEIAPYLLEGQPFRSFTDNLNLGGRIYTSWAWTRVPEDLRKTLRMELKGSGQKESSVDLDIKNLHLWQPYAHLGINYQEEGYEIFTQEELDHLGWDRKDVRKLTKSVYMDLLNCKKSERTGRVYETGEDAFYDKMNTNTRVELKDNNGQVIRDEKGRIKYKKKTEGAFEDALDRRDIYYSCPGITYKVLYHRLLAWHPKLKEILLNGEKTGLAFQREDSDCSMEIMGRSANRGVISLGIHDGWIFPASKEEFGRTIIDEVYTRKYGFSPIVKKKDKSKKDPRKRRYPYVSPNIIKKHQNRANYCISYLLGNNLSN